MYVLYITITASDRPPGSKEDRRSKVTLTRLHHPHRSFISPAHFTYRALNLHTFPDFAPPLYLLELATSPDPGDRSRGKLPVRVAIP